MAKLDDVEEQGVESFFCMLFSHSRLRIGSVFESLYDGTVQYRPISGFFWYSHFFSFLH